MPSLVARDLRERDLVRHRWSLVEGVELPLGRTVRPDHLQTGWDEHIAPWHAVVRWDQGRLHVARHADAAGPSPLFYDGEDRDSFVLLPGEGFVAGRTVFQLDPIHAEPSAAGKTASGTQFFTVDQLRTALSPVGEQLDVVNALLKHLQDQQSDIEAFEHQVVHSLKQVVRRADFAAILHIREGAIAVTTSEGTQTPLCEPLVLDACRKHMLVAHRWGRGPAGSYPAVPGASWAVCAPVSATVEGAGDYALYICGARAPVGDSHHARPLPDDQLSLVAIVADILQSVRTLHDLAQCRASMQEFFPRPIRDRILRRGPSDVFRTEQAQAAILFCDLRGSSKFAEKHAGQLLPAWDRIAEALSVMTEAITDQFGCIGDFQGDAAMGFWGWPRRGEGHRLPTDANAACQAADTLRERFLQKSRGKGPLAGFACGIGIAAGDVIAGMLGTVDQRKIGVFGPAVNLAARLETMTKQLGVSILVEDRIAEALKQADSLLAGRLRYLATVQPVGMSTAVKVHELMPLASSDSSMNLGGIRQFEYARDAFEQGNWREARPQLQKLALRGDGPSTFLLNIMDWLHEPPADWKGQIMLNQK